MVHIEHNTTVVHYCCMSEDAQLKIRLPLALKEVIEAAARAENRSMNGEIIAKLEAAYGVPTSSADGVVRRAMKTPGDAWMTDLEQRVKALEDWRSGTLGEILGEVQKEISDLWDDARQADERLTAAEATLRGKP